MIVSKILLVNEYNLAREGIRQLLLDNQMIDSVETAVNSSDAMSKAKEFQPEIIIMDLGFEHLSVFDVTRRMLANNKRLKIIVLTSQVDEPFPSRVLQAGAIACLGRKSSLNDLFSAIKAARLGKRYVSTDVAQGIALQTRYDEHTSPFTALSNRELQIMFMFVSGIKVQAIADKLCLSPKTVSTYRYRIFSKLNVRGDVEMTHMAMRYGVLQESKMLRTEYRKAS